MKWSIGAKIIGGYLLAVGFLVILAALALISVSSLLNVIGERAATYRRILAVDDVRLALTEAESAERGFVITGNESFLNGYEAAKQRIEHDFRELDALIAGNGELQTSIELLREKANDVIDFLDRVVEARRSGGEGEALALVSEGTGQRLIDDLRSHVRAIDKAQEARLDEIRQSVDRRTGILFAVIWIGTPLVSILVLGIGLIIARGISHPLGRITQATGRIAQGDLSVTPPVLSQHDEVGELSRNFEQMTLALRSFSAVNARLAQGDLTVDVAPRSGADEIGRSQAEMVRHLAGLIGQVQRAGVKVNSSAVEIAAVTKQQQATASEVASTSTEISSTAREVSATSNELLKSADQVSLVATETANLASQGKAGLSRIETIIRQIGEASATVTGRLGVMNEKATNIGSVITTIAKVADQTNLLSLNAAIEAEKAGEYGRGFAVVATEIRRLADQTSASSADVERTVNDLVSAISAGVMGMDKFSEEVRRSSLEAAEARRQIDEVIAQVQSVPENVDALHEGIRAQTQGAEQISDALLQLGEAARQTAESIRDSSKAVDELNDASFGLREAVSKFKVRE